MRLGWVGLAVLAAGCAAPSRPAEAPSKVTDATEKTKEPERPRVVNLGPGSVTAYTVGPERRPLWTLEWQTARLRVAGETQTVGLVEPAKGQILRENAPPIPYSALKGEGDQAKGVLELRGAVTLRSPERNAVLRCDVLRYEASAKIVKAKGNVRVASPDGTVSDAKELWATPDLAKIATPDVYSRL